MKKLILYFLLIPVYLLFVTCNDPIFYNISQEEELLDPIIEGSPTNFVMFNNYMYVASGQKLYKYKGTYSGHTDRGSWEDTSPTGKRIFALAVANNNMFALFDDAGRGVLRMFNGNNWSLFSEAAEHNIRSIHCINDVLFIGAGENNKSLYILYYDGNNLGRLTDTGSSLLNGAAYNSETNTYYLSTKDLLNTTDGAIYNASNLSDTAKTLISGIPFVGIINCNNNTIYAIDQNGKLYIVPGINEIASFANLGNYLATGALSIWEKDGKHLLLAGRKDIMNASITSGYTYGYLELEILPLNGSFNEPGKKTVSTVNNGENGKYAATIGKYPVNHIFQAPLIGNDKNQILFASTQKNGVWSYRQRGNDWHWNAEQ